jgi:hypothetical protein
VRQEEARHRALEHDDLDLGVGLDLGDDAVQLRNGLGTENVERRVIQRDAPVFRREALEPDLLLRRGVSPGVECSRRLAGLSALDACHCGSYECFSKDVRFHS